MLKEAQYASIPFLPSLLLQWWKHANVTTYNLLGWLHTCEYQLHPSWVSVCVFASHRRGATRQGDKTQPGTQHARCGLHSATNSGSLSSALCYLCRWNMPRKFWVRQMKGGSDQTAPWFHLSSHICTFSSMGKIPFSTRGFYDVLVKELKLSLAALEAF